MTFISNCTFSFNYIACQEDPFLLFFDSELEYCFLYFKQMNHTVYVKIDSIFKGTLIPYELERGFYEEVSRIATSTGFLQGILGSIGTFTSVGFISAFIIKIVQIFMQYKQMKQMQNEVGVRNDRVVIVSPTEPEREPQKLTDRVYPISPSSSKIDGIVLEHNQVLEPDFGKIGKGPKKREIDFSRGQDV